MRLFITGGTGFIGSHVLKAALDAGHEVSALRRTPQATPVIPLACQPEWCEGDLETLDVSHLRTADAVVHLAAVGVSPRHACWSELVAINVASSLRLMELGVAAGVRRYVVAGTCHEYGTAARHYSAIPPDAPLEPLNAYGASKAGAFQLLRTFSMQQGLELFYGRLFTVYGEGQYEGNFWPSLQRAALAGEDFPMTSGHQISDFIPVASVACHLLTACLRPDISAGQPLVSNVGSGVSKSLLEFAQAEWVRLGARGRLLPGTLPDRSDQIDRFVADLRGLQVTAHPCSQI